MTRAAEDKLFWQAKLFLLVVSLSLGLSAGSFCSQPASGSATAPGAVDCRSSLNNIGYAARHIREATLDIVSDVEQRRMAAVSSDPLIDDPPVNNAKDSVVWAQQMSEMGPLEQPRPQWLDADISHLEKWLSVLNEDFAGTTFGAGQKDAAAAWNEMQAQLSHINSHFKQLQRLSTGPHYDNLEIGKQALRIHDDVSKLEKPWRETVKIVQRSAR